METGSGSFEVPQGPDALFHQYHGLVGIGTGTIPLIERYHLVVKPALALDIGIYRLESGLPCFNLEAGYQFKIARTPRTVAYFRPGLAAIDIESYDILSASSIVQVSRTPLASTPARKSFTRGSFF